MVSSLFVVFFSFIPWAMNNSQGTKNEISVFHTSQNKQLDERGIVEYFSNYPLRSNVSHIEWKNGMLFIELHRLSNKEELYKDVYLILKECFVARTNVKQVRFLVRSPGEEPVFLNAKQEDVTADPQMEGRDWNMSYEEYLHQLFKLENNR